MDEAKSLVHMSVSAILATLFLTIALGLIGTGYTLWSYFSKQSAADKQMSEYANYTAFDNTVVRGQEVLQLIESTDDIFVLILSGDGSSSLDDIGITAEFVYLYAPYDYMLDINFEGINTTNENKTCKNSLTWLRNYHNLRALGIVDTSKDNLCNYSHSQLVGLFTNSTNLNVSINNRPVESTQGLGNYEQDPTNGNIVNSGEYSEFVSTLVYDEGTADVAGVILVRPKNTN